MVESLHPKKNESQKDQLIHICRKVLITNQITKKKTTEINIKQTRYM